jgi:hypothetical protein
LCPLNYLILLFCLDTYVYFFLIISNRNILWWWVDIIQRWSEFF